MVNQEEITSRNTIVPVAVLQGDQPETTALPVLIAGEEYAPFDLTLPSLRILHVGIFSSTFMAGYQAARTTYMVMEQEDEDGAFCFLTGYEYAHLARKYLPAGLPSIERREWQRGFIAGWNAATFGL